MIGCCDMATPNNDVAQIWYLNPVSFTYKYELNTV